MGILGISYNGFLTLMALVNPHPALKVAVPMNPMVDGWKGDDWFHNGAFRQQNMPYVYEQEATRKTEVKWWTAHFDEYDTYLQAGSAGALGRQRGLEQVGFWRRILEHPTYDAFWRDQAMDAVLAAHPLKVPVMLVHGLWDQEDIYGALAVYRALEPKDTANDWSISSSAPGITASKLATELARPPSIPHRHRLLFPDADPAAVPGSIPPGGSAQGGCPAGPRL